MEESLSVRTGTCPGDTTEGCGRACCWQVPAPGSRGVGGADGVTWDQLWLRAPCSVKLRARMETEGTDGSRCRRVRRGAEQGPVAYQTSTEVLPKLNCATESGRCHPSPRDRCHLRCRGRKEVGRLRWRLGCVNDTQPGLALRLKSPKSCRERDTDGPKSKKIQNALWFHATLRIYFNYLKELRRQVFHPLIDPINVRS